MKFQKASETDFHIIQKFYWDVIDNIHRNNVNNENLGWEKGIYPSDKFIQSSLIKGELYTLTEKDTLYACVILNSEHNKGYDNCTWGIICDSGEVLTPHALAVNPKLQRKGVGKLVVENILNIARTEHKKAVRLDVLSACKAAEHLYTRCGFHFVETKKCFMKIQGGQSTKCLNLTYKFRFVNQIQKYQKIR